MMARRKCLCDMSGHWVRLKEKRLRTGCQGKLESVQNMRS